MSKPYIEAEWWMEPLQPGRRVLVTSLDVYGTITHNAEPGGIGQTWVYTIVCEAPMAGFQTQQTVTHLRVQEND